MWGGGCRKISSADGYWSNHIREQTSRTTNVEPCYISVAYIVATILIPVSSLSAFAFGLSTYAAVYHLPSGAKINVPEAMEM